MAVDANHPATRDSARSAGMSMEKTVRAILTLYPLEDFVDPRRNDAGRRSRPCARTHARCWPRSSARPVAHSVAASSQVRIFSCYGFGLRRGAGG
ncbi:hypothetical protein [Bradyrhizobium sp. WSM1743]|uniref:hypothetical protein n=1 Tax=Bradyrhizobium sp. WSM1743 TaxID=318996 RepID=UPI003528C048